MAQSRCHHHSRHYQISTRNNLPSSIRSSYCSFFSIRELTCCTRPTRTHQLPRGVLIMLGHSWSNPGTTPSAVTRATRPRVKMDNLLGLAITSILNSNPCTVTKKFYSYVFNFQSMSSACLGFLAQCCTYSNAPSALVCIR
jgi:hypothetical protein